MVASWVAGGVGEFLPFFFLDLVVEVLEVGGQELGGAGGREACVLVVVVDVGGGDI